MSNDKQNIKSSQNDVQSALGRYVDAVRRYLPRKQRNDIALLALVTLNFAVIERRSHT